MIVEFSNTVFLWTARTQEWFFVAVPEELSADIREIPRPTRGFGSVRVQATVGATSWRTSIFPSGEEYVLPLKRAVREAENLRVDAVAVVQLEVLDA